MPVTQATADVMLLPQTSESESVTECRHDEGDMEKDFFTVNKILSMLNEFIIKIFMGDNVYVSEIMLYILK